MSLFLSKYLFALLILAITIISAWIPFSRRLKSSKGHNFPSFDALAAGIFLGAGLIHMLGDANTDFKMMGIQYPIAFLLAGIVFLFLLFLEHLGREIHEHEKINKAWVIIAVIMLSIHSLLAGTALGLSLNYTTAIMFLIAIIAHKWAASFALAVQINNSSMSVKTGLIYFTIFAIMTPLGVVFGNTLSLIFNHVMFWQAIFMSLAAGTFLYIGTLHGLSKAVLVNRCCNTREFSLVIIGFVLMAIVAIWA